MRAPILLPLLVAGCTIHPAPEDLDGLMRTLWRDVSERRDDLLRRDLATIDDILDLDALDQGEARGSQSPLQPEDIADLEFFTPSGEPAEPPDVTEAVGLHVINNLPCTESALLDVMLYEDQLEIYGRYDAYSRTYDDDPEAFRSGELELLTWSGTVDATVPGAGTYSYNFRAEARRVELDEGTGFLTRTWMPTPATWNRDNPEFTQDYQLEVWRPSEDGRSMLHIYPSWRVMTALGFDMTQAPMQSVSLSQMTQWDKRTAELCTEGLHPAKGQ